MTTSVLDAPARDELKRVESADAGAPPPAHVARFDRGTRALHAVIMVTFLGLSATGNVLVTLAHSPTPEDYLAGRGIEWAHLVLTPQQAQSLARDLLRTEGRSPQMMGEET